MKAIHLKKLLIEFCQRYLSAKKPSHLQAQLLLRSSSESRFQWQFFLLLPFQKRQLGSFQRHVHNQNPGSQISQEHQQHKQILGKDSEKLRQLLAKLKSDY